MRAPVTLKLLDRLKNSTPCLLYTSDTLIIGGTSLVVYPAAGLIRYFRGGHLVVINMQPLSLIHI